MVVGEGTTWWHLAEIAERDDRRRRDDIAVYFW